MYSNLFITKTGSNKNIINKPNFKDNMYPCTAMFIKSIIAFIKTEFINSYLLCN